MADSILLVDDDPNLLSGLQRHLHKLFDLTIAEGGCEALVAVEAANARKQPFAVVLCDMRMPGMDGLEVLSRIRELSPDTVRMMLTGNADQKTSMDAINQSNVFRFFTKPCPATQLAEGLRAGVNEYRLIVAERDLLEKTLAGSIKMLVDVVSMNDPVAGGKAARLREWIRPLVKVLKLSQAWQMDIAAMLLPIGRVAIPAEVAEKKRQGVLLTDREQSLYDRAPETGRNLIANIPRLGKVAEIIYLQDRNFDGSGFPPDGPKGKDIPVEARLLRILKDLAEASHGGAASQMAFNALERRRPHYDPDLLATVRATLQPAAASEVGREIECPVAALQPGHFITGDVRLTNGLLILAANTLLSEAQVARLRNLGKISGFIDPVLVRSG